jgi:2-haloacid dehalogenase
VPEKTGASLGWSLEGACRQKIAGRALHGDDGDMNKLKSVRYRWLLLDADGTLFDYDRAEADALRATFVGEGFLFDPALLDLYRRINAVMWEQFERGEVDQDTIKTRRFERLAGEAGLTLDPVAFGKRYLAHLAEGTHLIAGAEETLRALRDRCGLMVLTNGLQAVQRPRLARSAIGMLLDDVVVSEEVGAAKPSGRIFEIAWARMGHPRKDEVLMVGDSLTSDIRGGNDFGIDTCWFNPGGRTRDETISSTYEIARLGELLAIVDSI